MSDLLHPLGMGSANELALFMAAVFVLNATPGVDLLLTVSRTAQGGARAGVAAALGINAGCVVHALAAAFGLAALLAVVPNALLALQWAGAAWLLWLAWGMARAAWQAPAPSDAGQAAATPPPPRSDWADFRTGALTNILTPKVALFFLAFLPQFIGPQAPSATMAFLGLGAVFVAQSTVFLLAVVAMVAALRRVGLPGSTGRVLQGVGAGLFVLLAWRLLSTRMAA